MNWEENKKWEWRLGLNLCTLPYQSSEPSLIISITEAEPQHVKSNPRVDPDCCQQSGASNQHFSWNQNQVVIVKKIYFKTSIQTQTDVDIFDILYFDSLKSVGIYFRLICGFVYHFVPGTNLKVICFQSFCGQTQRKADLLRLPCWFIVGLLTHCVTHCVTFESLFSPSCKMTRRLTRCCLRPLLTQNLLNRSMSHYQFPFQPGCMFCSCRVCVIGWGHPLD